MRDRVLLLILLGALAGRLYLAVTAPYIHDEDNTAIPLSQSISLAAGNVNLPLRGENHGALPAYIVKASSTLFGTAPVSYRALHVVLAVITIVLVSRVALQWYGPVAGRWAAALMAFNEYHLTTSARASAHGPFMFFVAAAVFAFSRFLATERAAYLYAAGAATGLAFYCKEHAALLLPVFFVVLLARRYRPWLLRPHAYLAAAVFALIVAPDVAWNLRTGAQEAQVAYGGTALGQATYSAHLQRFGGIGLSPYPSVFYARPLVTSLYRAATGEELSDVRTEYHSVNPLLGLLLVGGVLATTFGAAERTPGRTLLLVMAWGIFGFFSLIEKGDAPYRLTSVNWVWVEATLVPTTILLGARLASLGPKWRTPAWILTGIALLYAVDSVWRA